MDRQLKPRIYVDKRRLQSESQCGSDNIQITGLADAIILPEIIEFLRVVFIEDLDAANGKAIAHPAVDAPVVKHFIGDKQ